MKKCKLKPKGTKGGCTAETQTPEVCLSCIGSRIISSVAHLVSHFTNKEIFTINEALYMANTTNNIGKIIGEYVTWRMAMKLPPTPQETQMLKTRDELQAFFKRANEDPKYRV